MSRAALLALSLAAACSRPPSRPFPVGLLGPVTTRVAAATLSSGLVLAEIAPVDAAVESAASSGANAPGPERMADWARLRFLASRAAVRGAGGVFFRLPSAPAGRDVLDYPEEWQALTRVAREIAAVRPILESETDSPAPFELPAGVDARAWTYEGRRYVLLVNASGSTAPLATEALEPWRALFTVRSDPRESLLACGDLRSCLPPAGVLWLEGRLQAGEPR